MIKLIIAGGRDFTNFSVVENEFMRLFSDVENKDVEIISGLARGADALGVKLADMYELKLHKYPAQWDKYGKSAGYRRNAEMGAVATHLLVFWDQESKGTKHMIDVAVSKKLKLHIITY
tara:strand:- start:1015 stop:1371 length:357 start_codon:yes stop_codon:yes gene_type:complete